jgi:PhnB protein
METKEHPMTTKLDPCPEGFAPLSPYLMCKDTAAAIAFYQRAFEAKQTRPPLVTPDGVIMNAELEIAGSRFMLSEQMPDMGTRAPDELGFTSVVLMLHVCDADAVFQKAVDAGCEVVYPLADQFYGQRTGRVRDPFGHAWIIGMPIEDVSPEEMVRRFQKMFE